MPNRLADAVSPYLRSHADNPVDWYPWGPEAFAEATRREVPVLVSIGYATCHWCHVMARESFSDPHLAAFLNARFVAIKVDREEHPEVDSAYLTAAGAFTPNLGWPLNAFATPTGRVFHAGTYWPPAPARGLPSFRQVLDAVANAWATRRDEVEQSAAGLAVALAEAAAAAPPPSPLDRDDVIRVAGELVRYEDGTYGGFGGAPKFPVAPVLATALGLGRSPLLPESERERIGAVAVRALAAMRDGGLRDPVEGGFFRYATQRDWSEPHYERMLPDNALLLPAYAAVGDRVTAGGIVAFLEHVLRRPSGAFGSAQDSESVLDGRRDEGGYYRLDAAARARVAPPAVDGKVLTGWNGLAIGGLADAATRLGEPGWLRLADQAADAVLGLHYRNRTLLRASLDGRASSAVATLEDWGGLADGLLRLALATGQPERAIVARDLVDACLQGGHFVVPGGGDPVLTAQGVPLDTDPGEGASPSGTTLIAGAAWRLYLLTGQERYRAAAAAAIDPFARQAVSRPIGFGGLLGLALAMAEPVRQTIVVTEDRVDPLARAGLDVPSSVTAIVTPPAAAAFADAGFELFDGRGLVRGAAAAYLCEAFVCRLPVTDPAALTS